MDHFHYKNMIFNDLLFNLNRVHWYFYEIFKLSVNYRKSSIFNSIKFDCKIWRDNDVWFNNI